MRHSRKRLQTKMRGVKKGERGLRNGTFLHLGSDYYFLHDFYEFCDESSAREGLHQVYSSVYGNGADSISDPPPDRKSETGRTDGPVL